MASCSSLTIDKNLIHPAVPLPWLLYVHATIFTGWLGFFVSAIHFGALTQGSRVCGVPLAANGMASDCRFPPMFPTCGNHFR
jgi:hypothetical protein